VEAAVCAAQVQRLVVDNLRGGDGLRDLSLDAALLRICLCVVVGSWSRHDGCPPCHSKMGQRFS